MADGAQPITSLQSFEEGTSEPRQLAAIYFYSVLDCLVDLAYFVSCDFFARPQLYTSVGGIDEGSVSATLARLHARYGCDEGLPSHEQRDETYYSLFGPAGGQETEVSAPGDFARLRDDLIAAAAAFATRVFDEGVEMLRERVRSAHRTFKEYLLGLHGDSVRWSRARALAPITEPVAYAVLRSREVGAIFGLSTSPKAAWPYDPDSNGDKLVEQVSRELTNAKKGWGPITREVISAKQRTALRGAQAIASAIDFDESQSNDQLNELITRCYTWGSSLRDVGSLSAADREGRVGRGDYVAATPHASPLMPSIASTSPTGTRLSITAGSQR